MTRERRRAFYRAPAGEPQHDFDWFENCAIPQSLQFMIDCLPAIRSLLSDATLPEPVTVLDAGTRSGAGANLLASLHRVRMLGPPLRVDALDIMPEFKTYADAVYPDLHEFVVGDIFQIDRRRAWDLVICSHTIEHLAEPRAFILELQRRAKKWLLLYAPFEEMKPDGVEHLVRITRDFVQSLDPIRFDVFTSPGWQKPGEPDSKVVLFVLPGVETLRPPHSMAAVRAAADTLWAKSDFAGAVKMLEPVVKRNPQNAHAAYCLAFSLSLSRRYAEAIPHYTLSLENGFDEFWNVYNRGCAFLNLARLPEAVRDLRRAAELNPTPDVLETLAAATGVKAHS